MPVVLLVVAGRPLLADYSKVDAVMMAWLPGSEGRGVVDGLLGEGMTSPSGRMPVGLPPSLPVDPEMSLLFAKGAGMSSY